jgi:hypothetical protein
MIVFLVVLLASLLLQLFLPWWIMVIISFVACAILGKTSRQSIWAPFFAILILWTAVALFKTLRNDHILLDRIAEMLALTSGWLVMLVTVILGSFVAAIAGFCGYHFKKAFMADKSTA